jgi:hypothetical protein
MLHLEINGCHGLTVKPGEFPKEKLFVGRAVCCVKFYSPG